MNNNKELIFKKASLLYLSENFPMIKVKINELRDIKVPIIPMEAILIKFKYIKIGQMIASISSPIFPKNSAIKSFGYLLNNPTPSIKLNSKEIFTFFNPKIGMTESKKIKKTKIIKYLNPKLAITNPPISGATIPAIFGKANSLPVEDPIFFCFAFRIKSKCRGIQ